MNKEKEPNFHWVEVKNIEEMRDYYISKLPAIRIAAKECGYAIGLHGSLNRDFDLIAVPWVEEYSTVEILAQKIHQAACGLKQEKYIWEKKPCHRIATSFPICFNMFYIDGVKGLGHIDLSVIGFEGEK